MTPFAPDRRDVLAGAAALTVASAPLARAADAPATGRGHVGGLVYEDRGDGSRTGLPGVLVSNGQDVVRTGPDGRYALPVEGDCIIFVVKPSGFQVPLDADNLPRFFYIHQPGGTPGDLGLRYSGLAPTGPLPDSIDFGLRRVDESARFDVLLFTDPQPESRTELGFVRDTAVTRALGRPVAFGLTLGDIAFDDLSIYGQSNHAIGCIGVPWHHLPGNHDLNFEAPDSTHARETFKRVFGPPCYAFNHADALFIALDNVRYLGPVPAAPGGGGTYVGEIGTRQLAFVQAVLAATPVDRLVVVAMHIPLRTHFGTMASVQTADAAALLALLAGRKAVSFAGHTHTTEHHYLDATATEAVGPDTHHHHVLTAVSGSWWSGPLDKRGIAVADSIDGTPHGFHILSIDGTSYTTTYMPASEPPGVAMRIALETQFHQDAPDLARDVSVADRRGPVPREALAGTRVVVNVFDGGPRSSVRLRVGARAPQDMKPVRRRDPVVTDLYARNPTTVKSWVKAAPSAHIWTGTLPTDLAPGTYTLHVDVTDEYGRPLTDAILFDVTA